MDEENLDFREIDFGDYWRVLIKRLWLIIGFFLIVVTVTALTSLTSTPIFQAKCQILIERSTPNLLNVQEMFAADYTGAEFYQTQYKILESRALARDVIRRLNLTSNPEFVSPEIIRKQNSLILNSNNRGRVKRFRYRP